MGRRLSIAIERTLDAPMEQVWALLRDYAQARPRILTEQFSDYVIHQGGRGAGTVIGFDLRIGRRRGAYLVAVEEPTPGRQLRERDRSSALVATWTLTPAGEGESTLIHPLARSAALRAERLVGASSCAAGAAPPLRPGC